MDELHRKILRENRSYLVDQIDDVEGINDILMEKQILTNNMNQEILAERTKIAKTRKLLDTLPRRGQFAFDIFCNVLIKTNQRHIAERLNPELKHSSVTALPAEPVPGSNKVDDKTASSQTASIKQNSTKPSYPVPVQVPVNDNKSKSSVLPSSTKGSSLPNPYYPIGATGTATGSQPSTPNDETYQPTFGRQESREATQNAPSDEEVLHNFPKPESDWPYKLDMTLSSSAFQVKNCTAAELKQQLNNTNAYPMPGDKVRRAVIISNRTFDGDKYEERKLADMDSFRIQQVLKKLDFKIQTATNVDKEDLLKLLTKEREQEEMCVFVLVVLSYGGNGTVMCTDGELFPVQDILNLFSSKNCPLMANVPKLFLLQACGTIMKDFHDISGVMLSQNGSAEGITTGIEDINLGATGGCKTVPDTKGSLHTSESATSLSDPLATEDNMLVAVATTADVNHAQYSSLFMLGLSYVISNYAKSDHFITLLKGVNKLKKSDNSDDTVKLCEFKHSFTKNLYLLPGYPHDVQSGAGNSLPPPLFGSTRPT